MTPPAKARNGKDAHGERFAPRLAAADWDQVAAEVNDTGCALLPRLLTPGECAAITALYDEPARFRATIDMERYRFGRGEYKYFAQPFPEPVRRLREQLYPLLLPIARDWAAKLHRADQWPDTLAEWLAECHRAGQARPTPILLRYQAGDWNALHRDLYGEKVFPLQVVINLSEPGRDHTGGEFLLVEQRPRAQSRGTATLIPHGHGLVFTTRDRPVRRRGRPGPDHDAGAGSSDSTGAWSAAPVRHGVSAIRSGRRHTLGLVFHDAA